MDCSTCNSFDAPSSWCRQFNLKTKSTNSCPVHSNNIITCQICGGQLIRSQGVILQDLTVVCEKCAKPSCGTCKYNTCAFVEDKSMPDTIIETKQNGPMIMQQQIMNPEKIRKHCLSCHCFSEEFGCLKQYQDCNNYIRREIE